MEYEEGRKAGGGYGGSGALDAPLAAMASAGAVAESEGLRIRVFASIWQRKQLALTDEVLDDAERRKGKNVDPEAKGLQPGDRTSVRSWVGLAVEVAVHGQWKGCNGKGCNGKGCNGTGGMQ